jgi:hypothetical protein
VWNDSGIEVNMTESNLLVHIRIMEILSTRS